MPTLASDIMTRAAAFLNDTGRQLYTNTVLLPFLQDAYDELQQRLEQNEIPIIAEDSSIINVAANATTITSPPSDLVRPISMEERADESSDDWIPVDEVEWIDSNLDDATGIVQWAWREETICINPPTTAREIKLKYQKALTAITGENSAISVKNSTRFLAARTASLAATDIGENPTRAAILDVRANVAFDAMINLEVKQRQSHPVKPKPYGAKTSIRRVSTILSG